MKRTLAVVLALSCLLSFGKSSDARGLGRFLGGLLGRGLAREAIVTGQRSNIQPQYLPKTYGPDILTVEQLAACIKKAVILDENSERLEASRTTLLSSGSEIDLSSAAIEFQRPRVDHYSKKSVDAFNALINRYNVLAVNGKAKQASFNALVDTHNTEAGAYNVECAKKYYADDLTDAQKLAPRN
jgi:hypothetical protein